jgi:hypothetical protein
MSLPKDLPPARRFNLLITGDIVVDHHLYEGERPSPMADHKTGLRDVREHGGAAILDKLLRALIKDDHIDIRLGISKPPLDGSAGGYHAYAYWTPHLRAKDEKDKKPEKQEKIWRTNTRMGYGHAVDIGETLAVPYTPTPTPGLLPADVLVLDDAGFEFRSTAQDYCWLLPKEGVPNPSWIILKMSNPIGHGDLWYKLIKHHCGRLVCIVSIDDLRLESVNISRGLSWERTVEDLRNALSNNPTLAPLETCAHLIVKISADGALWIDRSDPENPLATLVFDADGAEGVWTDEREGDVFGMAATLTAAIAREIMLTVARAPTEPPAKLALVPAIKSGLVAMRDLHDHGHGPAPGEAPAEGFPAWRVAQVMTAQDETFASAPVPAPGCPLRRSDGTWMIIEDNQWPAVMDYRQPLIGLARQIVFRGLSALRDQPHGRFGKLVTVDRNEIETLRSLRRLMVAYAKKDNAEKPLSIGVFGRPGSGKSFGVKEIAKDVFGEKAWLEFNLSQFDGAKDLIGAFHQVRDKVLSGVTPVVFWDEFDSKSYDWLQYLLAPMQDGRFQEGQISHWIGKCVVVFAGGTTWSFEEFSKLVDDENFQLRKGPDFVSRLDGYYDVIGPNQRTDLNRQTDPSDVSFPLRRALLMRSQMRCKDNELIEFDSDLLDALLLVREYRHGARSLEKLVTDLRARDRAGVRPSWLPPPGLLAMHTSASEFQRLLRQNEDYLNSELIDTLAAAIHHNYLSHAEKSAVQENFRGPFDRLSEADKAPNRAAARRYPRLLSLIGARLVAVGNTDCALLSDGEIKVLLNLHIERLAEEEHRGWMEERTAEGWRYGKVRNNGRKIHDRLIPYDKLDKTDKDKDRDSVRSMPSVLDTAGFRIAWLQQPKPADAPS